MRLASAALASTLVSLSLICCIDPATAQRSRVAARSEFAKQNDTCFQCHSALNPGLAQEWLASAHGQNGIGCYDCHKAEKTDSDAFEHNGATIAVMSRRKIAPVAIRMKSISRREATTLGPVIF